MLKKIVFPVSALLLTSVLSATDGWHNISDQRPAPPAGTVYWQEDFENAAESDFKIEFRDGAKGEVKIVEHQKRNGKKSLFIKKSNHDGYIVITPVKPCNMPANTELQCSIYTHCRNANSQYTPAFIRMYGKTPSLAYFKDLDGRGPGGPKMSTLANTAVGVWERKLCHRKTDAATGNMITPVIVVAGPPSESYWDDWKIENFSEAKQAWNKYLRKSRPAERSGDRISDEEFDRIIAADIDHTAKIITRDGVSRLVVDGQEVQPVFFKESHSGTKRNVFSGRILQNSGVELQVLSLRLGVGKQTPGVWSKDGLDVDGAVKKIRQKMQSSDKSKFIISFLCEPYPEFTERYPDEVWMTNDGFKVWGHSVHASYWCRTAKMEPHRHWYWVSMFSTVWRQQAKENISILIEAFKKAGLSKRIIGIHIGGFHDHQFALRHLDYSVPAEKAFRRYLKEKYGTIENLSKSWGRKVKSFERIYPPQYPKRDYLLPGIHQDLIDFFAFQKSEPFRVQEDIAAHAKAALGKDVIAVRWCMEAFGGSPWSALDITQFVNSKVIDALVAQPSYENRTPGYPVGTILPLASFHRNRKLYIDEFDLRTYGVGGNESELRVLGLSRATDFPMWQSIHYKVAGRMVARNMGYWYFDMADGWFNPPEIAGDIKDSLAIRKQLASKPVNKWQPDAVFVVDEASMIFRNYPAQHYNRDVVFSTGGQIGTLSGSSVMFDVRVLDDFLRDPALARSYKVIIFSNMTYIDAPRRKLIESLKNNNRTLVFLPGAGRLGGADVTGLEIYELPGTGKIAHEIVPESGFDCNMSSLMYVDILREKMGVKLSGNWFCPVRYSVKAAPGVKVFSRFKADGAPAVAMKEFAGYRIVAVGAPSGITPEFFNKLLCDAGAYVPARSGLQLDMNGNFMAIHTLIPGRYEIKLPFACQVRNIKSGKMETVTDKSFTIDAEAGSSYWFELIK